MAIADILPRWTRPARSAARSFGFPFPPGGVLRFERTSGGASRACEERKACGEADPSTRDGRVARRTRDGVIGARIENGRYETRDPDGKEVFE